MKKTVDKKWPLWQKFSIYFSIAVLSLLLLIFLTVWVVVPLVFMNSKSFQSYFMFMNTQVPKNPKFSYPEIYGIEGVINVYITTEDIDNSSFVSIGAWMILPKSEINTTNCDSRYATNILRSTAHPILLYLHGVACNRIAPVSKYDIARKYFMVIAVEHRGYGDSDPDLEPSELCIVSDIAQIYKWIRSFTKNDIFIWGHSLGAALGIHAVKNLKENDGIVPMGLILESAFTTMREEVASSTIGKLFKWLPYFEQTIQRPLEKNGFIFDNSKNILSADCPIMIMHAEDDNVIPFFLGEKLSKIAQTQRDIGKVGDVTFYPFAAYLGYSHNEITNDPNIPNYLETFVAQCRKQNKSRG